MESSKHIEPPRQSVFIVGSNYSGKSVLALLIKGICGNHLIEFNPSINTIEFPQAILDIHDMGWHHDYHADSVLLLVDRETEDSLNYAEGFVNRLPADSATKIMIVLSKSDSPQNFRVTEEDIFERVINPIMEKRIPYLGCAHTGLEMDDNILQLAKDLLPLPQMQYSNPVSEKKPEQIDQSTIIKSEKKPEQIDHSSIQNKQNKIVITTNNTNAFFVKPAEKSVDQEADAKLCLMNLKAYIEHPDAKFDLGWGGGEPITTADRSKKKVSATAAKMWQRIIFTEDFQKRDRNQTFKKCLDYCKQIAKAKLDEVGQPSTMAFYKSVTELSPKNLFINFDSAKVLVEPPGEFCCKITYELMKEPVVLEGGGHTNCYEKNSIQDLFNAKQISGIYLDPFNFFEIRKNDIKVNGELQKKIQAWVMQKNGPYQLDPLNVIQSAPKNTISNKK